MMIFCSTIAAQTASHIDIPYLSNGLALFEDLVSLYIINLANEQIVLYRNPSTRDETLSSFVSFFSRNDLNTVTTYINFILIFDIAKTVIDGFSFFAEDFDANMKLSTRTIRYIISVVQFVTDCYRFTTPTADTVMKNY